MAKLNDVHKRVIVQALACWDTPTEVSDLLREQFGIDVPRTQVAQYDPTKVAGKGLAKKWVDLFHATRDAFRAEAAKIPIAEQSFRLRALGKIYERHMQRGNVVGAAAVLEQAAKESGGMFTNKRELSGPGGGPIPMMPTTIELVAPDVQQSAD
ncbi:DUF2280 domain-containing protein [Achromobacter denitrificans]|uniref:DUF2280 domain-containing protein n=1 Tax=Achromobacter denitrificans TaxID=32002 RepID=UPI000F675824|nr:DUF2280 domain-containing protein [Achromobacter denitrificans]RSE88604.1 DUF2280 domain-containing protein [Achromobacter denitrificans]